MSNHIEYKRKTVGNTMTLKEALIALSNGELNGKDKSTGNSPVLKGSPDEHKEVESTLLQ